MFCKSRPAVSPERARSERTFAERRLFGTADGVDVIEAEIELNGPVRQRRRLKTVGARNETGKLFRVGDREQRAGHGERQRRAEQRILSHLECSRRFFQAEEVFEDIITQYNGKYILAVEGNPPLGEQGMFCISSGRPFIEKLKRAAAGASAIIAWGTCASWGCVQAARPNPTQATPIDKVITDKPIIKVPGCPPIPDVMSAIITYMVTFDRLPDVDRMGRPLMFYGQRIHDKCYRRAHFDAGEFVQSWDDDAARKGYCLYKMGCKGPTTYNACSSTRWNDGVSFPIQSGHGCLGCAENGFWDRGSFYSRVVDIPQMGTHSTADTVGLTALGVVAAAVGVHAVASAVDQRRRHNQQPTETEHQPGNEDKQA